MKVKHPIIVQHTIIINELGLDQSASRGEAYVSDISLLAVDDFEAPDLSIVSVLLTSTLFIPYLLCCPFTIVFCRIADDIRVENTRLNRLRDPTIL